MGKNRTSSRLERATQERITRNLAVVTQAAHLERPSKAELRASIPPYDESIVKRIEPGVKAQKRKPKKSP